MTTVAAVPVAALAATGKALLVGDTHQNEPTTFSKTIRQSKALSPALSSFQVPGCKSIRLADWTSNPVWISPDRYQLIGAPVTELQVDVFTELTFL